MDPSRISTCSIALIDYPPEKAFQIIRSAGYEKVDVLERDPHLSLFSEKSSAVKLKAKAENCGLQIANLSTYTGGGKRGRNIAWSHHGWEVGKPNQFTESGFSSDQVTEQERELEQLKQAIDLADYFGARSIRAVPGNDRPSTIDQVVPWFKKASTYAEEKNVYIGIEHEAEDSISGTPELLSELIEKVDSPYLGVLYEPGNLMVDIGVDYRQALEKLKDYVVHCHFKDGKKVGDKKEFVMMGQGEIDFPWIVDELERTGYSGDYALEYELDDPDPETGIQMMYDKFLEMF